jgi:cytochrome c biogenesis protein CcdA
MRERTISGAGFLALAAAGIGALLFFFNEVLKPGDLNSLALPVLALTAGVAATFNPCGLPALPGFLTFIGGSDGAGSLRHRTGFCLWASLGAVSVILVLGIIVAIAGEGAKGAIAPYFRWVQLTVGLILIVLAGLHLGGQTERLPFVGPVMAVGSRMWERSAGKPTARGSYLFGAGFVAVGSG